MQSLSISGAAATLRAACLLPPHRRSNLFAHDSGLAALQSRLQASFEAPHCVAAGECTRPVWGPHSQTASATAVSHSWTRPVGVPIRIAADAVGAANRSVAPEVVSASSAAELDSAPVRNQSNWSLGGKHWVE